MIGAGALANESESPGKSSSLSEHSSQSVESHNSTETRVEIHHSNVQQQTTAGQRTEGNRDPVKRLNQAKLKACQRREGAINKILTRSAARGEKQLEVLNKISERTQAFYAKKGKTLSNYNALVFEVNSKKGVAQTAVAAVKSSSASFRCDGTDPKGTAESFKTNLKNQAAALKAYKTAVKNLIAGVRNAQGGQQ